MIVRSVIAALVFLVGYSLLLPVLRHRVKPAAQHQWQENMVKAETYLYEEGQAPYVIVGSSLSCRLQADKLPAGFYNLSFAGLSLFDGLLVVLQKKQKPKIVFVELNILKRSADAGFAKTMKHPVSGAFKAMLPMFRASGQPTVFAGQYLKQRLSNMVVDPISQSVFHPLVKGINQSVFHFERAANNNVGSKMIEMAVREMNTELPKGLLANQLNDLQYLVKTLQQEGVKVILFEMPMAAATENSLQMQELRDEVKKRFSGSVAQLAKPDYSLYTTTDGVHLTDEAAAAYSVFFAGQAAGFLQ